MGFGGRWKKLSRQRVFIGRIVLSIVVLSPGKRIIGDFREAVFTQQFCLGLGFPTWQKGDNGTYTRMSKRREALLSYVLDLF